MDHNRRSNSQEMLNTGAASNNNEENRPPTPREEREHYVPLCSVTKIMRNTLPELKSSDDAKETIQACITEYIRHITAEANQRCQREFRKTITADDLISAMAALGFTEYVEPLSTWLDEIRTHEMGDASAVVPRRNVRACNDGPRDGNGEMNDGEQIKDK